MLHGFELIRGTTHEKIRINALGGNFPGGGLGAVGAELGRMRMQMRQLGPGAADAGKTARLVLLHQYAGAMHQHLFLRQDGAHRFDRSLAAGGLIGRFEFLFLAYVARLLESLNLNGRRPAGKC